MKNKTDTIVCTIKNSYAAKYMLIYVICLTINFVKNKKKKDSNNTHIHIYKYMHIYTHTHTYIYTYVCVLIKIEYTVILKTFLQQSFSISQL